jgi:hypothetical protein
MSTAKPRVGRVKDPVPLPPAEDIAAALEVEAEKAAPKKGDRWANRDRSKPAGRWSGKP